MHFNATVTGYFTLPHKLFTSTLPLGIYLGDFGSSLFFIVSGASLALTVPAEQNPAQFYKRRARAVYPLFWLAWFVVFSYRFVAHPGSFGGARTVTLVLTLLGLDNFAVAAGWVGTDFACVGEWFLGSILFLYLLFPLLQRGLRKRPWLTWALTLAVCIPVHLLGWDARLVAVHIPEFLFGMTFLTLAGRTRYILARCCWRGPCWHSLGTVRSPARWPVPGCSSCWRWRPRCWTARGPARWAHSLPKYPTRCSLCITF